MSPATPKGLRYPAGGDPLYNVPAYLQNLAEDIDAKVQHAGNTPGRIYVNWTGLITCAVGTSWNTIPMPTISWVRGAVVTQQVWSGGVATRALLIEVSPLWGMYDPALRPDLKNRLDVGVRDPTVLLGLTNQKYAQNYAGKVGLSVLAWGDPNPPP